ncbi:nuclear transport factor 2 family protein [Capillimicrobium parvum]|uniref:SnoaL-like domain-containing protein n=1 Tax=Capillimicrobium parvum TaxID=2884022 RepID=A0A9E6XUS0_9ACTN|nr:nuclear transport factor 2 family protein [Capillimicrobium parvum]UGS34839.1 hypothetical protein DSM104329_01221 [Capillimicrobium parvum]
MDLAELIARREIEDVLLRYYRGIDRLDWPLVESCFHPDAHADFSGFGFSGDRTAFLAFLQASETLPAFERTMHVAGNMLVEVDGDVAHAETYCVAHHRGTTDHAWGESFALNWLRYCDRLDRRGGRWAIAQRVVVVEWGAKVAIDEWLAFAPETLGRRDRSDPSYRR